jgi:hypothetical protein
MGFNQTFKKQGYQGSACHYETGSERGKRQKSINQISDIFSCFFQYKTKQNITRQDKTGQDKTRQESNDF